MSKSEKIGIYIHVPFCEKKCPYCDFYSCTNYNNDLLDSYTEKVCNDLKRWSRIDRHANTLYFGGGTPSLIGAKRLAKIIESADKFFSVLSSQNNEVTVELNPIDSESFDFKGLYTSGVNRLSIGLQSSNDAELKALGRRHTPDLAKRCVLFAQDSGFNNISLDLMTLIPRQTKESLISSIDFCESLNVQHISAYMLKIEQGTEFFLKQDTLSLPNEDTSAENYILMCDELQKRGFDQYEISNFSKRGYQARHNLKYWKGKEYLGIGPSSHSFIDGNRFYYEKSINKFLNDEDFIKDGPGGGEEEYIMLRLRLSEGVKTQKFKKRFKYDLKKKYFENARIYKDLGLTIVDDSGIRLTKEGFLVSNRLISRLLD